MKKQKMPKDINELAAKIVALATGQEKPEETLEDSKLIYQKPANIQNHPLPKRQSWLPWRFREQPPRRGGL